MTTDPIVVIGSDKFYFAKDAHTGTLHIRCPDVDIRHPFHPRFICGLPMSMHPLPLVSPCDVLPRLTQGEGGAGMTFGDTLAHDMYMRSCANCQRVLEAKLKKVGSDLPGVLEELGAYYCRENAHNDNSARYRDLTKPVYGPPGVPKSQLTCVTGDVMYGLNKERKEEMASTNIVTLKVKVEFNMDNVDLKDIMEAIDEIQQAATNYGKIEECDLFSVLPLKVSLR